MENENNDKKKRRSQPKLSKRTVAQKEIDVAFCSNLFLRGYNYRDIAAALNRDVASRGLEYTITHTQIFKDMKACLIEWKRQRLDNIDDYVTQELRKLDKMENELWEAWESSKVKTRNKVRESAKPRRVNAEAETQNPDYYGYKEDTTEVLSGNPRYLDLLLNVQQRRAKLLGFDAPIKVDVNGSFNRATDDEKPKYDMKNVPDELLFSIADKLQSAAFIQELENKGKPIE